MVSILVFWLNFFAFTFMFGTLGLAYLRLRRKQALRERLYFAFVILNILWLLSQTFFFFFYRIMDQPQVQHLILLSNIRFGISVIIAYLGPAFLLGLALRSMSRTIWWLLLAGPLLTVAIALTLLSRESGIGLGLFSMVFNGSLGVGSLFVLRSRYLEPEYRSFLWLHGIIFILFGLSYPVAMVWEPLGSLEATLTLGGLFILLWSINDIGVYVRYFAPASNEDVPDGFIRRYGISPRETQIVALILSGRSQKEIAGELGISPRTAESHLYRIYRKCEVGNRVELLNTVRRYS
ncbi:MAG: LuxR family transcriptional regulator [Spirochaetaceae bacterium]|nr:MAG: LuxR family transcriptional regulator [Spirochaetaceae bacterium]